MESMAGPTDRAKTRKTDRRKQAPRIDCRGGVPAVAVTWPGLTNQSTCQQLAKRLDWSGEGGWRYDEWFHAVNHGQSGTFRAGQFAIVTCSVYDAYSICRTLKSIVCVIKTIDGWASTIFVKIGIVVNFDIADVYLIGINILVHFLNFRP